MKIRPKNIQVFQLGGGVPQWYLDRYGNRTALLGWDLNQRYNYANQNLNTNDHRNAGNLDTVYRKNMAYTGTPGAVSSDILAFYNSDGNGMSALEFVDFYNKNAADIRSHWALNQTYGKSTAGKHNRLFRKMFTSRSNLDASPGSDYNIGYLLGRTKGGYDIQDIEGSSTWLRRMDLYEKEFDPNNPDSNRLHEITLKDGTKALVYKKANGDIGLYNPKQLEQPEEPLTQNDPQADTRTLVQPGHNDKYGFDWNKLKEGALKILGNPDLYAVGRLAGNLINNERVYDEQLKGIKPVLRLTYNTHRQVVGDEATKLAYYRRAAQGETRAARPFTSDADRQVAYMNEAKRIGDELRAQGDLADNAEIRRTSDESNQHLWANTQRATEVANANLASINQANALKHNLLALKHSAQWSSIDNFLQGIEYRKRLQLAEEQALDDQIFALQLQQNLLYDSRINNAQQKLLNILDKHKNSDGTYDYNNQEVKDAIKEWKSVLNLIAIENWREKQQHYRNRNTISFVKSGTKVTRKRKDDLLYKSTRDVVEHFRKMSKLSSDALDRKIPKIEKLTSHPKGKTRRYLLGGVAPFTVYKPVALGGETTTTTNTNVSSSRKGSDKDETLDMIKELFKLVAGKGLPSDVNSLYTSMLNFLQRAKLFGEDISTDDIASMYLSQMQLLNLILYLKSNYDKAEQAAISNDAINEFAVDYAGRLACQNTNTGEIEYASSLSDAKEKGLNPLTNGLLLQLRAVSPSLAGHSELDSVVANGIGMSKIALFLKSQLPSLGSSELTIEGYTKKGTNDIINGLKLLQEAPEGNYKYTHFTKDLQLQAAMAINYLRGILPSNMRQIIKTHAELGGLSEELLIGSLVSSNISGNERYELDTTSSSGKTNSSKNSGNGEGDMLPSVAFFNGLGEKELFIILDKTNNGLKINTISTPITSKGYNTGSITFDKLESSDFGGQLLINLATMGDSLISSTGRNNIIIDGRIYLTELPIDQEVKRTTGIIKPDLKFLKKIEIADAKLKQMGIDKSDPKNIAIVNKIYLENNLPILYTISNNKPTITSEYARFAIVNGIGTEEAFGDNPEFNDSIQEISSDKERQLFETMMQLQGNSKYKLDNGYGIGPLSWGETKLYKGIIYIPMVTSNISALAGTGFKAKGEEYNLIEARQQAADAAREMGFNPAGDASNLL